ncbi:lectin-like domain-containing protein [Sphingobium aquiterrae]|uniref:lectin-like domain-containing protein n=1 Tax=Sphingobium aquiterrae TaxID=2038656 RepID=UPI003015C67D
MPNNNSGGATYAAVGTALGAVGDVLRIYPDSRAQAAGRMLASIAPIIGGQGSIWDAQLTDASAGEIFGGVIASVFVTYAVPFEILASIPTAAGLLLSASPVAALVLAAGFGLLTGYVAWELGSALGGWLEENLSDLLNDILSDPLVFDLDGDGIELNPLSSSITEFDIDGDGALERMGWVSPHDGLLVHDANQNGQVDEVGELFGSAHIDGFDDLAAIDTNADNKIDQLDSAFADLRMWRDLNSDGVSTSDEMLTMAQAEIESISLTYVASGADIEGNQIARVGYYTRTSGGQRDVGSVWFETDETGNRPVVPEGADISDLAGLPNMGGSSAIPSLRTAMYFDATLHDMVNALVNEPHSFSTFKEFLEGGFLDILYRWVGVNPEAPGQTTLSLHIEVIESFTGRPLQDLNAHQLERIRGVWDNLVGQLGVAFLMQAAASATVKPFLVLGQEMEGLDENSPDYNLVVQTLVAAAVSDAATASPAYDYLAKFVGLQIDQSTGAITGDFDAFAAEFIKDQPSWAITAIGQSSGAPPRPLDTSGMTTGSIIIDNDDDGEEDEPEESFHPWTKWFNNEGKTLFYVAKAMGLSEDYVLNVTGWRWLAGFAADVKGTSDNDTLSEVISTYPVNIISATTDGGQTTHSEPRQTHDQRLYGFGGSDELWGNDGTDRLVGGTGNDLLSGGSGSDMYIYAAGDGLDRITEESGDDTIFFSSELDSDFLQVIRISSSNDLQLHFGDSSQGIILTNQVTMDGAAIENFSFVGRTPLSAGDIATKYLATLSTSGNDAIVGTRASENIYGLDGNDTLSGWDGQDILYGGAGNDSLNGENDDDVLRGEAGADVLDGGNGNDIIMGGEGNDTIQESWDNDTYIWNLGDGDDTIVGAGWWDGFNTIQFGAGITPDDLIYSYADPANGNSLKISIAGQPGSITIDGQMTGAGERIDQISFADNTALSRIEFQNVALSQISTVAADSIWGSGTDDVLTGNDGDDFLEGRAGNDVLSGGTGNDLVRGGDGNDTLEGGAGTDRLEGGSGDDLYLFELGFGSDIISDNSGQNSLNLGIGISIADIRFSKSTTDIGDMVLSFISGTGSVTLDNQLTGGNNWSIGAVKFSDGTIWSREQLLSAFDAAMAGGVAANTAPVIDQATSDVSATLLEASNVTGSGASLTGSGALQFSDAQPFDIHSASIVSVEVSGSVAGLPSNATILDWLDLGTLSDTNGTISGSSPWSFSAVDSVFDYLAEGESVALTYVVAVKDAYGASVQQNVVVNIQGANDEPTGLAVPWQLPLPQSFVTKGSASYIGGQSYQLTPAQGDKNGAVWSAINLATDIEWNTRLYFGANDGGADGLSFSIASNPTAGSNYSYGALTPTSLGIRFDTYSNSGEPSSDFSQFILNGSASTQFDGYHTHANVENNGWHDVRIHWDASSNTLSYSLDGSFVAAKTYDVVATILGGDANAFFGFGAATGGAYNEQRVEILSINAQTDTLKISENAESGTLVGILVSEDADIGDMLTFTLVDSVGIPISDSWFEIVNGNELRVKAGAVIDYEAVTSHDLHVAISDSKGASKLIPVKVMITNIVDSNEAPTDLLLRAPRSAIGIATLGSATSLETGIYQLTPAQTDKNGAIWGAVDLAFDTVWTTRMFFGASDGGADGVAFAFQNDGANVLADTGVVSGESLAIKFDTYSNGGEPNSDFTQVVLNGAVGDQNFSPFQAIANLEDNAWHDVIISWNSASHTLSYAIDGTAIGSKTYDVVANLFDGSSQAYYGFGGRTGGAVNDQRVEIKSVTGMVTQPQLVENAPPGTLVANLYGIDANAGDTFTYSIVNSSGVAISDSPLEIVNGNELRVKSGSVLDFEADAWLSLNIKITDSAGSSIIKTISVAITDQLGLNLVGTTGNDVLVGSNEADALSGLGGDDRLQGGLGNDAIDGGTGTVDVAVFAGTQASYSLSTSGGVISITDVETTVDGNDGTDSLTSVEKAEFKGGVQIGIAAPIILDLNGDGVKLTPQNNSKTRFDWDDDGISNRTGWVSKNDGMLVYDRNGDGKVTNAKELSFIDDRPGAKSDLDGLSAFDTSHDGMFSIADANWADFRVWRDRDADGKVDRGELMSMEKAGVSSIALTGTATERTWGWDENLVVNVGEFTRTDGSQGSMADVALSYAADKPSASRAQMFARQLVEAVTRFRPAAAFQSPINDYSDEGIANDHWITLSRSNML